MNESRKPSEASADHWLVRPATVRGLWAGFGLMLLLTVVIQFWIKVKGTFELDGVFGFGAWFGFGACIAMVLAARILGWLLKRPESYYDDAPVEDDRA